ncbi:MAG: SpoIIE family protein phosphatase [Microscillaceae bacterium]|jgi:serine phosphatase RsbU (regulator of sigma subunit)|nr:SpoIIE family protein phosphatase [Microscillaceae bacterium]
MQQSLKYRLTSNYLLALGLIALLTVVSYLIVRSSLVAKRADARVISVAGRQSTLGQKIIRTALVLEHKERNEDFGGDLINLKQTFEEWAKNHQALQAGNVDLGLPGKNSPEVQALFKKVNPHFESIQKATQIIIALHPQHDEPTYATLKIAVDTLLRHENYYLRGMKDISARYDREANQRLRATQNWQFGFMILTLTAIVLQIIFIFRPVVRRTIIYLDQILESKAALEKLNASLKISEESNRQKAEELRASEEEIRQNMEELAAINENLVRSTEELRQKNDILKEAAQMMDLKNKEIKRNRDQLFEASRLLEAKNESITNSIRYARRIQEAIIPEPPEVISHFKDAFIFYQPRDIVSGDFYWFSDRHHKKVVIAADCTGHGVPGALMTMMGNSLINEIVNEKGITNPSEILSELDKKIVQTLQRTSDADKKPIHDGMDVAVLTIDSEKLEIEFAAAHNPLYYMQDGEMLQIKGSKFPVGSSQYGEKAFDYNLVKAKEGDVFYIFTDGFQDQYSQESQRKYMSKRFRSFLLLISHLPMEEQRQKLIEEFHFWKSDSPQTDDILVIGIKF